MQHATSADTDLLLLIDGHALAFNSWYSSEPPAVIPGFMGMLAGVVKQHHPEGVVVTFDPAPPTFRHDLYPAYKGNRPEPPVRFLDECSELERLLGSYGVQVCKVERYEADDVIGTLVTMAKDSGRRSLIYTCDLDLLQVVDDVTRVHVFSQYWPDRMFDVDAATCRFNGITPPSVPDLKALMGDRSDNLPGVPGIGEKSATIMLKETRNLETLYEDLDRVAAMPVRGGTRLARILDEHREDAFLMKTLATIVCDVPVDIDLSATDIWRSDFPGIGEPLDKLAGGQITGISSL